MLKTPFFALLKKEFLSVWKDKKSRSIIFLPPILQLFIFSHAATLDITNIKIGILDNDNTEITREFIREIKSSRYFNKIYNFKNKKELNLALDEEKIRAGVYINNDFTCKYKKKKNPEIFIITDGRRSNSSQITSSYITQIANSYVPIGNKSNKNKISFEVRNKYNKNLFYHYFIIASLAGILPMSVVILLSSLSVAREKENGTFDELIILPLSINQIILGKLIPPLVFGIMDGIIIVFLARIFFNLPFLGSFIYYLFSLSVFLISISGLGLFISLISKTQSQAIFYVFMFMFPMMILSGYTTPIENIAVPFLKNMTIFNPLRFFLVISRGIILKKIEILYIFVNLIPIIFTGGILLIATKFAFKNKKE